MQMELEEIQCSMCKEQFNERVRVPMLLPDCGHSYCIQCIEENSTEIGFNLRRRATVVTPSHDVEDGATSDAIRMDRMDNEDSLVADDNDVNGNDDEDLTKDDFSPSAKSPPAQPKFTFKCPEDK